MYFRLLTVLGVGVVVALSTCSIARGQTGATAVTGPARKWPIESATAGQKAMFAEIKPRLLKNSRKAPLVLAKSRESYFWIIASRLNTMIDAYEYSGDTEFLEVFVRELWKAQLANKSYGWEAGTLAYLKACARPVSWQQRHLADIPKCR